MGLRDELLGGVLGGGAGAEAGCGSGLGGLLEQMQRAGFGDQARRWVGTGENMSISPDAIGQIFQGGLDESGRHANLTPEQTSEGLSQLLPEAVDHRRDRGADRQTRRGRPCCWRSSVIVTRCKSPLRKGAPRF